jgi:hypothetical protein
MSPISRGAIPWRMLFTNTGKVPIAKQTQQKTAKKIFLVPDLSRENFLRPVFIDWFLLCCRFCGFGLLFQMLSFADCFLVIYATLRSVFFVLCDFCSLLFLFCRFFLLRLFRYWYFPGIHTQTKKNLRPGMAPLAIRDIFENPTVLKCYCKKFFKLIFTCCEFRLFSILVHSGSVTFSLLTPIFYGVILVCHSNTWYRYWYFHTTVMLFFLNSVMFTPSRL